MDKMIAFCGINCSECPALIATQKDDDNERKKTAELWNKEYKTKLEPKDINCLGCLIDSEQVFNYCKICEIRKCGKVKKVENCAHCIEYPCELLNKFLANVPKAKANLEEVRKTIKH